MKMLTSDQTKQRLSANVSFLMEVNSVSLRGLAAGIGEHHTTLRNLTQGLNDARASTVAKIAEFFSVSTDDLFKPSKDFQKKFKIMSA